MLQRSRILAVTTLTAVLALFLALEIRLFFLQVVNRSDYVEYMDRTNGPCNRKEHIPVSRGAICDANKAPLAMSVPVLSLWIDSRHVDNKHTKKNEALQSVRTLSNLLKMDIVKLKEKFFSSDKIVWRCIKKNISDPEVIFSLLTLKYKRQLYGINLVKGYARRYPNEEFLGHTLGVVGHDGVGVSGIELLYNDFLKGRPGFRIYKKDWVNNEIFTPDEIQSPGLPGGSVNLTIDSAVQLFAEVELSKVVELYKPKWCCAIVIEPATGRILASASMPSLNPSSPANGDDGFWKNNVFSSEYIPGSTFKPLAMLMAHDRGVIDPDKTINVEGGLCSISGRRIEDVHRGSHLLTPPEILIKSSNVGMAKIFYYRMVPKNTPKGDEAFRPIRDTLRLLGLGIRPGVLPGTEISGRITPLNKWSQKFTNISISFGNEMSVTPVQMAAAFSTIANGGKYVSPRLVDSITFPNGKKEMLPLRPSRRVFAEDKAIDVTNWTVRVVEEGSGRKCRIPGVRVGGKTGTSEKLPEKIHVTSSFIAFAPADDPALTVLVVVDEPKGAHYASEVAAPHVKAILEKALYHLGVACDSKGDGERKKEEES